MASSNGVADLARDRVNSAPAGRPAVFYDFDGTLSHGSIIPHYLFYARRAWEISDRARRFASLLVRGPGLALDDRRSRRRFQESFYANYRGLSRDRLELLSEELFRTVTLPSLRPRAKELVASYRRQGYYQVLVTGSLDVVAQPVARHLGVDEVLCNHLVFRDGVATGALEDPVLADAAKALAMVRLARQRQLDLERSHAYGDSIADLPMLSTVGRPFAVNPDSKLQSVARHNGWPIIDLHSR